MAKPLHGTTALIGGNVIKQRMDPDSVRRKAIMIIPAEERSCYNGTLLTPINALLPIGTVDSFFAKRLNFISIPLPIACPLPLSHSHAR